MHSSSLVGVVGSRLAGGCRWATVGPRAILLVLASVLSVGCASSGTTPAPGVIAGPIPETRGFDGGTQVAGGFTNVASAVRDTVVPEPRNRVWAVLPAVFDRLGVETPTLNPAAFTIGDPGSRIARIGGSPRLSQYLDCGIGILGPNADNYDVTMQLIVQLGAHTSGGTVVRTTLDAYAQPRSAAGDPLHCASQRTLEGRIMSLIAEELNPVGPSEGTAAVAAGVGRGPAMSAGRLPVTGDLLRIECRSPLLGTALGGEGRYLSAGNGNVVLQIDGRGASVAVPAANVVAVQIRERRSRAGLGGFLGAVAGATAGGLWGNTHEYDPNERRTLHFGHGVYVGVGVVAGAVAGFVVGRLTGSLIKSDTWHEAPPEWAIRTSGASPDATATPSPCPTFERS